ncbi:DUF155-domain-containing protein [Pluteus cervinus]|uniref:DUF155-domain-containing protein n=1 Tax=Pluteus cervinus TaxID=181527 RepID=A0ACD3B2A0_9AGAR|nr:DUF155-domain-containing protein [Pluteus cervinus]
MASSASSSTTPTQSSPTTVVNHSDTFGSKTPAPNPTTTTTNAGTGTTAGQRPTSRFSSLNVNVNLNVSKPKKSSRRSSSNTSRPTGATVRRSSVSGLAMASRATTGQKSFQRTSKTSQKLVELPSDPQTKPFAAQEEDDDLVYGRETEGERGLIREYKSPAERMSKDQRKQAGYKRLTAYCVAEGLKMKTLAPFLKREHNVAPRVYDEALYVMYHLPLLPGYGPNTNIRSSAPTRLHKGKTLLSQLSEAEENGYQGTYFNTPNKSSNADILGGGYISGQSPVETRSKRRASVDEDGGGVNSEMEYASDALDTPLLDGMQPEEFSPIMLGDIGPLDSTESVPIIVGSGNGVVLLEPEIGFTPETGSEADVVTEVEREDIGFVPVAAAAAAARPGVRFASPITSPDVPFKHLPSQPTSAQKPNRHAGTFHRDSNAEPQEHEEDIAEVVFFEYGVVVFFGLEESQERDILEDIDKAGIMKRKIVEADWEVEECHYAHDRNIMYPRIYNDFFTLKSRSHLLKLSIAHALAQSTLLAHYESTAQRVLSSPLARSIPQQLAVSGGLKLRRHDALKLTGLLFKLKRDVNLVSNVLDVPELFWSEASLKALYDAVREYMEIKGRIQVLNEKLGIASDFLDAIHDHLNNSAMERITWIIIWLIVVACLVELGEVIARLVVHAGLEKPNSNSTVGISPSCPTSPIDPTLFMQQDRGYHPPQVRLPSEEEFNGGMSKEELLSVLERMMNREG